MNLPKLVLFGAVTLVASCTESPVDKLTEAAGIGEDPATVRAEIAAKVDVNGFNFAGLTPLASAANVCELDNVRLLLAAHADPNLQTKDRIRTLPIIAAAGATQPHCIEVVQTLIAAGANVNVAGADGESPLTLAARDGDVEMARTLIAAGADVNGASTSGGTPLDVAGSDPNASPQSKAAIIQLLKEHGGVRKLP
jgi:ankyrin repeat protein